MKILCIDCEGPITLNDNAFEICQHFLPQGEQFFKLISSFDDYLADVIKKKRYQAGGTLKLIAPFLKAHGVSNEQIKNFSREKLRVVAGAKKMLNTLKLQMNVFIISTSYTPYISALCEKVNFPLKNTFSTFLDLDSFPLSESERRKLLHFYQEINTLHLSPLDGKKTTSSQQEKTIYKLNKIFFEELTSMDCSAIMTKVNLVGGEEKERAVEKLINEVQGKTENTIYVGDSITDAKALKFVKINKGVSLSFNGNIYALKEAEFACISSHAYPLFLVIREFEKRGREGVIKMAYNWPQILNEKEKEKLTYLAPNSIFIPVKKDNLSYLVKISEERRKKLRGEKIGNLG